jgi:hypothetical protein
MNNEVCTGWTEATTDVNKALIGLISCLESGYNAWLEIRKNGDQDFPIKISNPVLNKPENWTMSYGIPRPKDNFANERFLNETEKDLTLNWIAVFGEKEAADNYYKTGKVSKENFKGMGYCHAVKIEDANKYRKSLDGYSGYSYWATRWQPRNEIPYWMSAQIEQVFTVCYTHEPCNKAEAIRKAGEFLIQYANTING